jgi:antirestriction protein ArdC
MSLIYEKINSIILSNLEKGVVPWQRPWNTMRPQNFATKHEYTGANFFLTSIIGGTKPYFLTFKQIGDLNGSVKAGAKALPIVYWNFFDKKDAKGESTGEKSAFLKYYNVFHSSDIKGIDFPAFESETIDFKPVEKAEEILSAALNLKTVAEISYEANSAFYTPSNDKISMPARELFKSENEFYSTIFHEAGHSTGHSSRLNRKGVTDLNRFGSHEYSKEELVAELTSAYLCAESGIDNTIENSSSYIAGWSRKLKENSKWFIEAAGKAQKAADFILNKQRS